MRPTLEELLNGSVRWNGEHETVQYEIAWWGRSEYQPEGIWNYYLVLSEQQFLAEDWAKLRIEQREHEFNGSLYKGFDYDNFPDLNAHGGWTFGEIKRSWDRKEHREFEVIKVGCDYNHSWDHDMGFPASFQLVEADAKRSCELLAKMFPQMKWRSRWSGRWAAREEFYVAKNGAKVLKSEEAELRAHRYVGWMPKESE